MMDSLKNKTINALLGHIIRNLFDIEEMRKPMHDIQREILFPLAGVVVSDLIRVERKSASDIDTDCIADLFVGMVRDGLSLYETNVEYRNIINELNGEEKK